MKVIHVLSLVFIFSFAAYAAGPSASVSKLLILDLTEAGNTIVAVGERGHVIVQKAGQTGEVIRTDTNATLTAVCFIDELQGWAAGHDAVIFKTTDGGLHWQKVYEDPGEALLDIWFADNRHGIAIGAYGLYLVTNDGGMTWEQQVLNITDRVTEANPDAGYAPEQMELHLNAIAGSDTGLLYIVSERGHIYVSEDSGSRWMELSSPYPGSLFGILPFEQSKLLVFGLRGHLYYSEDAGSSWIKIESHTQELLLSAVQLRSGTILVAGMGGVVIASKDSGRTFELKVLESRFALAAIKENMTGHVYAAGEHGLKFLSPSFYNFSND